MRNDDDDVNDGGGDWIGDGGGCGDGGTSYIKSNKSKPMSDNDTHQVLKRLEQ